MTVRPTVFCGPMVRALLEGRKTQTRRLVTWHVREPGVNLKFSGLCASRIRTNGTSDGVWALMSRGRGGCWEERARAHLLYAVGDVLWVREAWRTEARYDARPPRDVPRSALVSYEADYRDEPNDGCRGRYRHGRFMPRWVSRLTLEVTGVKVERLQDISEADAMAEGVCQFCEDSDRPGSWEGLSADDRAALVRAMYGSAVRAYHHLWQTINGPGSWDANPWIVAVTFTVYLQNVDAFLAAERRAA